MAVTLLEPPAVAASPFGTLPASGSGSLEFQRLLGLDKALRVGHPVITEPSGAAGEFARLLEQGKPPSDFTRLMDRPSSLAQTATDGTSAATETAEQAGQRAFQQLLQKPVSQAATEAAEKAALRAAIAETEKRILSSTTTTLLEAAAPAAGGLALRLGLRVAGIIPALLDPMTSQATQDAALLENHMHAPTTADLQSNPALRKLATATPAVIELAVLKGKYEAATPGTPEWNNLQHLYADKIRNTPADLLRSITIAQRTPIPSSAPPTTGSPSLQFHDWDVKPGLAAPASQPLIVPVTQAPPPALLAPSNPDLITPHQSAPAAVTVPPAATVATVAPPQPVPPVPPPAVLPTSDVSISVPPLPAPPIPAPVPPATVPAGVPPSPPVSTAPPPPTPPLRTAAPLAPPPVVAPVGDTRTRSQLRVAHFGLDQTSLSAADQTLIDQTAAEYKRMAADPVNNGRNQPKIHVTGGADTLGDQTAAGREHNQQLSERRALAIRARLIQDGIDPSKIETEAAGTKKLAVQTGAGVQNANNRYGSISIGG